MSTRECYKADEFTARIEKALGITMPQYTCSIVNKKDMTRVMSKSGWNKNDSKGVVGFHVGSKVFVRDDTPWTTLHELIHRGGINADRINRHLAEGLTELIAEELKQNNKEHKATYPSERRWMKMILKKLGMTPIEFGSIIAKSANPPREVAQLFIDKGLSKKNAFTLMKSLKPQVHNAPSLNRIDTSRTIIEKSGKNWMFWSGLTLIVFSLVAK